MGIHQKITLVFLLVSTLVYSQEKPSYFQPSLLRASATIAPTRFFKIYSTAAMLNGYVEYVLEDRISVRGEVFQCMPGVANLTFQSVNIPRNYTGIYAGFGYHIGKRNWKHSIHLEPGVSITEIAQDNINFSYKWGVNPSYLLKVGTCLYVSRFFDFFAEINLSDSYVRNNPATSVSMAQIGISAGLGFHLLTKTKK
jgi:hypothetical protein